MTIRSRLRNLLPESSGDLVKGGLVAISNPVYTEDYVLLHGDYVGHTLGKQIVGSQEKRER